MIEAVRNENWGEKKVTKKQTKQNTGKTKKTWWRYKKCCLILVSVLGYVQLFLWSKSKLLLRNVCFPCIFIEIQTMLIKITNVSCTYLGEFLDLLRTLGSEWSSWELQATAGAEEHVYPYYVHMCEEEILNNWKPLCNFLKKILVFFCVKDPIHWACVARWQIIPQ